MDNLIIGIIVLVALIYVGSKIYKTVSGSGGCNCGESKSSGCGSNCHCSDNEALGIKSTKK